MSGVRLQPSPWLQAVESNRTYLHRLEPDRLTVLAPKTLDADQIERTEVAEELVLAEAELAGAEDDETRRLALEAVGRLKALK